MILWISGQSGAGKTTLSDMLTTPRPTIRLDGDVMREVWPGLGFTRADRYEQNLRVARLAAELERQGYDVIVSTICPYRELRGWIDAVCSPRWVYLPGGRETDAEHPFEPFDAVKVVTVEVSDDSRRK